MTMDITDTDTTTVVTMTMDTGTTTVVTTAMDTVIIIRLITRILIIIRTITGIIGIRLTIIISIITIINMPKKPSEIVMKAFSFIQGLFYPFLYNATNNISTANDANNTLIFS
jgi:hypothetical protein